MPIVGIFTTWNGLDFIEKPDSLLKKKLGMNPVFPFHETDVNIYVMTVRSARFALGIVLFVLMVIVMAIVYYHIGHVDEMMIFPCVVALFFLGHGFYRLDSRTYVLDSNNKTYSFYQGERLIHKGPYHNVYIRLKGQNSGGGDIYYNIILGGYNMEEYEITGSMPSGKRLTKMGRRLAHRLDLNYFDSPNVSRSHVIRHRPPVIDLPKYDITEYA